MALQLFDSAGEKRIFHLPRLITYYKMIMKRIVLICLLFFLFYSCGAPDLASSVCQYDRAEVYYLKDPCWLEFGFNVKLESFSDEQSRCLLYSDFTVTDRDSLNYISRHIAKGAMSASSPYKYWCPRIIVLLHSREVVDTLITNTYTDEPVQFNSFIMNDSTLSLYRRNVSASMTMFGPTFLICVFTMVICRCLHMKAILLRHLSISRKVI